MSTTTFTTDLERVAALHDLPLFLPWDHLVSTIFPMMLTTFVVLVVLYRLVLFFLLASNPEQNDAATLLQCRKISYQFVNFCINLTLGSLGLYLCGTRNTLPRLSSSLEERITTNNVQEPVLFSLACIQLGYQLWALPVGLFLVQESKSMLCHHVAVLAVAFLSAFCTNGFVFHNFYFYGLFELSSVPLAVMNFFKDHDKWRQGYPQVYFGIRIVFSVLFLYIRIYMMIPRKYDFLKYCAYLSWTAPNFGFQLYLACCCVGSFFLACLQVFWATLILKGFYKLFSSDNNKTLTRKQV